MTDTHDAVLVGSGVNASVAEALLAPGRRSVAMCVRNEPPSGAICIREDVFPGYAAELLPSWHPLFLGPVYAERASEPASRGMKYLPTDRGRVRGRHRCALDRRDRRCRRVRPTRRRHLLAGVTTLAARPTWPSGCWGAISGVASRSISAPYIRVPGLVAVRATWSPPGPATSSVTVRGPGPAGCRASTGAMYQGAAH